MLVGSETDFAKRCIRLHRVGYKPQALLFDSWQKAGLPTRKNEMIQPQDLTRKCNRPNRRSWSTCGCPANGWACGSARSYNIPLNELPKEAIKLDRTQRVITVCNSAYRSSLAVGVLERAGFDKAGSMAGGGEAWIKAGLPVFEAKAAGAVTATPKREVQIGRTALRRRSEAAADGFAGNVRRWSTSGRPNTSPTTTCRVRKNVDIAELLDNPAYLTGAGPLVVVAATARWR